MKYSMGSTKQEYPTPNPLPKTSQPEKKYQVNLESQKASRMRYQKNIYLKKKWITYFQIWLKL